MSWIRSSKGAILGALLAVSLLAVGTAAALSVSGTAPAPAENGTQVSMTATINSPFEDAPDQWTLRGDTALQSASWTVVAYDQRGNVVTRTDTSGANVTQDLNFDDGATRVNVSVSGTVPPLSTFDYGNLSAENYTVLALTQQNGDAVDRTWKAHRFTAGSRDARQAIDDAAAAVDEAGGDAGQDKLDQAIDAYDSGNFGLAQELANEAKSAAEKSQGGLPFVLIGGAIVVILVVAGGGYYYYQSQQGGDYKLQ